LPPDAIAPPVASAPPKAPWPPVAATIPPAPTKPPELCRPPLPTSPPLSEVALEEPPAPPTEVLLLLLLLEQAPLRTASTAVIAQLVRVIIVRIRSPSPGLSKVNDSCYDIASNSQKTMGHWAEPSLMEGLSAISTVNPMPQSAVCYRAPKLRTAIGIPRQRLGAGPRLCAP